MDSHSPAEAIAITKSWIEDFVLKLDLCPFAAHPFKQGKIHFKVCENQDKLEQRVQLFDLISKIDSLPAAQISNAFLIYSSATTFRSCLAIRDDVTELMKQYHLHEHFQLVVFHPEFQFAKGRSVTSNQVNQSPLPMIHILRQDEVNDAIAGHGQVEDILRSNDIKLQGEVE